MKTILTIACVILSIASYSQVSVPRNIQESFKTNHPTHDYLTWTMEYGNFKASSIDNQKLQHVTVYDPSGNVVRTEREIVAKDIPTSIIGYFNEKYPGDMNFKVWVVEDKEGNRTYSSTHNDVNIVFDKEGRINPVAAPGRN